MKKICEVCGKEFNAKPSDVERGWGKTCSKSCAAKLRERKKSLKPIFDFSYIKQKSLDFQRDTGLKPDLVYVSIDIAKNLENELKEWLMSIYKNTGISQRSTVLHSIHGAEIDGLEFNILFGKQECVIAFNQRVLDIRARKKYEDHFYGEFMKDPPQRLG